MSTDRGGPKDHLDGQLDPANGVLLFFKINLVLAVSHSILCTFLWETNIWVSFKGSDPNGRAGVGVNG